MPPTPSLEASAPQNCGTFSVLRDGDGQHYRPGGRQVVSVACMWGQAGRDQNYGRGEYPALLLNISPASASKQYVDLLWLMNYEQLLKIVPSDADLKVPRELLAAMAADSRIYLQTNWASCELAESLTGDVEVKRYDDVAPDAVPADAIVHAGLVEFSFKGSVSTGLRPYRAKAYRPWGDSVTLLDMLPPALAAAYTGQQLEPPPCLAHEYETHLAAVPVRGGWILDVGAMLMIGADECIVHGVAYEEGGAKKYAYMTGDGPEGFALLSPEELARGGVPSTTVQKARAFGWLGGRRELVPSDVAVAVPREAITSTILVVNPAIVPQASLLVDPSQLFTFELAARGGHLEACRRVGKPLVARRVRALALLQCSPTLAKATIGECVIEALAAPGAALDPATVALTLPFALLASLTCFIRMKPSAEDATVLLLAFVSDADVEETIGLSAWHSPTRKKALRYLKVATPPDAANAAAAFEQTKVFGMSLKGTGHKQPLRREVNFMCYETATRTLKLRLSVAEFNNTTRIGGASVGKPPAEGGPWKYSLLAQDWVPRSTPAAPPKTLLQEYAAGGWEFW